MDYQTVADKIKDKVNPDLGALIGRDRMLLAGVCSVLHMPVNDVNMTQVMCAMVDAKLDSHNEYPKMVYPVEGQPGVTVQNAVEEKVVFSKHKPEVPVHKPDKHKHA